ncbi:MAG: glutathione peroxidase [Succinivibrionaceae bacterium]|nr:glutathione peroxidase [Succinivibrionaceae bacterium]
MDIYNYSILNRDGKTSTSMNSFKGKVLLIVNTATGCGFTPQYQGLEAMYQKFRDRGFEVLDFPCNQFGHQAPGTNTEINDFCTLNYSTTFPRFAKVDVNGANAIPLFKKLVMEKGFAGFDKTTETGAMMHKHLSSLSPDYESTPDIKWNFTKFLIGRDGNVIARFEPTDDMARVEEAVEKVL